ncbi:hypothetical protein [Bacillus vallismortis]|uniref:Uncharacterized protein n=1 Tax=Bacillus vallismortis TaxID=72361 RepID=A0AAP3CIV7_BACVA|nr:hypothetical protein [Bacillus vallismortis]MBG9771413.1 hypothetical protein [Bacillus vallismortis]MCY8309090.1 hypothetical protein [Bacillus vallismortis]MCY8317084.1 hypothetical protein [Bacillus vallismortis]MEC1268340.1 hypothetical protein [Bacillus vallismortis]QAV09920.1 hypothetical protein BV11031_15610 [Bacillus vallismortis]
MKVSFPIIYEIIGNHKMISSSVTSLLAEPAGIQKGYEEYTQLFIWPNSFPAPYGNGFIEPVNIDLFEEILEKIWIDFEVSCYKNRCRMICIFCFCLPLLHWNPHMEKIIMNKTKILIWNDFRFVL